jgi:DNA-binding LytR/AlgR family response regulator
MKSMIIKNSNDRPHGEMTIRQQGKEISIAQLVHEMPASSPHGLSPQLHQLLQLVYADLPEKPTYKSRFLVKKGHQLISVPVTDIKYFYSKEKICFARTADNRDFTLPHTIAEIESMVSPAQFFRVSRKYIISHAAIVKILVWFNGKLKIEIQPGAGEEVMVSRERVNSFKNWLGE